MRQGVATAISTAAAHGATGMIYLCAILGVGMDGVQAVVDHPHPSVDHPHPRLGAKGVAGTGFAVAFLQRWKVA